jgi:hypothetical protein
MIGETDKIKGSLNKSILSGATSPNRSVNKTEKIRSTRTGTAIRAGYWNEITGKFSTNPVTDNNDTAALAITSDNANNGTRVTFLSGSIVPTKTAL